MTETVADIVRVCFEAGGHNEVARAFDSVAAKMARFEKSTSQSAAGGVRDRVRGAQQESKAREAAMAALAKEAARWEADASKSADKAAKAKVKSDADANRARLREETELARQKARILDNSARYAGRVAEQQASAEIRQAERVGRERVRIAERAARETTERTKKFASGATGIMGGATSRVLGGVGMLGGAALAIGGGLSFADSIRGELEAGRSAAVLSNSAFQRGAGGASGTRVDPAALVAKAKSIQAATGLSKGEVLSGMQAFVAKTGHAEILGADDTSVLEGAKLAKATGSSFADVMNAQGILVAQNKDFQKDPAKAAEMLRNVVAQGKMGAVEMTDLASIAGKITASSAMYEGDQGAAQRKLLALSQIVFPVAGSADETATSITHLGADALKHSSNLQGLDLFDKKSGRIKGGPEDILTKVLGATGGNIGKIQALGFGERSIRAFEALAPDYQRALESSHGDKKAAMASIGGQIGQFTNATMSKQDVDSDLAVVMSSRAEKLDQAMIRLKEILADKGVPILDKFVTALEGNMPQIEAGIGTAAKWFEWFSEHPAEGIGALILANVAKDLAGAAIGEGVKKAITALLGAGGGGAPVPTPGAGGGSPIPGYLGAAALTGAMAFAVHESGAEGEKIGKASVQSAFGTLSSTEADLKAGKITPAQADRARRDVMGFLSTQKDNADTAHQALDLASVPLSLVSSGARADIAQTHAADEVVKAAPELEAALKNLAKVIEQSAMNAKADGTGAGMSSPTNPSRTTTNAVPRTAQ